MEIKTTAFLVALLAASPYILELTTRAAYPVPAPGGGVVLTGASTGIGAHAAHSLAEAGFLVFAGVRKEADGEALKANAPTPEAREHIVPIILDVTKQDQIDAAVKIVNSTLTAKGGVPLVGLVNNAGVGGGMKPVEFENMEDLRNLFDVNYFGAVSTTKAFLSLLRDGKGRVINISSMAGLFSAPMMMSYCGSKFALEAFSDTLRVEVQKHGVSVSVVEPAYVQSAIFGKNDAAMAKIKERAGSQIDKLYGHVSARPEYFQQCVAKASPPSVTSDAILHALTSKYPQTRYVVANVDGKPAKVLGWVVWLLNDRLRDRMVVRSVIDRSKARRV